MALIAFTPFVNGQTLTAANLTTQQTEITAQVNGNLDSTNIISLQNSRLVSPKAVYCITVPLSSVDNTTLNLAHSFTIGDVDFPVAIPAGSTLIGMAIGCRTYIHVGGNTTAEFRLNAVTIAATVLTFVTGGIARVDGLTTALAVGDTMVVRIHTNSATAGDGASMPVAYLWLKMNHVV